MNKIFAVLLIAVCYILFSACNSERSETETTAVTATQPITNTITEAQKQETQTQSIEQTATTEETAALQMTIDDTPVSVDWQDNESVQALKEFCSNQPLMIQMSRYGGFEQVGSIGTDLPQNDVSTTTSSGDIVLYSGNQMVVFYGSNTWAYTRLGHITDKTQAELT
ncbi:MAG: hypothetical protein II395_00635, partial [Ruminococcus sp.]|nr:hypothetical protein [Ruminococcus sp.]